MYILFERLFLILFVTGAVRNIESSHTKHSSKRRRFTQNSYRDRIFYWCWFRKRVSWGGQIFMLNNLSNIAALIRELMRFGITLFTNYNITAYNIPLPFDYIELFHLFTYLIYSILSFPFILSHMHTYFLIYTNSHSHLNQG